MKYYRLIDNRGHMWPSFVIGKVYPENHKCRNVDIKFFANSGSPIQSWQEVPESEYILQEVNERYKAGTRFICANTNVEATISTGIFKVVDCGGVNEIDIDGNLLSTHGAYHCVYDTIYKKWAYIISKSKQEMEELKITKERVLSAAEKCSTAKATLKELFPEVFETDHTFLSEGMYFLECSISTPSHLPKRDFLKIPGDTIEDKAESIARLIYETWIR